MEKVVGAVLVSVFTVVFLSLLVGFPVKLLWNWLMPVIFGLPQIGFLQAVGLCWLMSFLFGVTNTSSKSD